MKNTCYSLFSIIVLTFIFSSCMTMRPAGSAASPAGPSITPFIGTWTLSNITYSGVTEDAVPAIFDQAPPKDFVGSTWILSDSGACSYTLTNGISQNITWSVNSGDALGPIFQFKKLNKGQSPESATTSYQMVISKNDGTNMILKTLIYLGNKNGYVVYNFNKVK